MKQAQVLSFVLALASGVAHAETLSFAAVKNSGVSGDDVAAGNFGYTDESFVSNTSRISASGDGNAAQAQTLQGINRVSVSNSVLVTDEVVRQTGIGGPFALALSVWTDNFTITGGVGAGTVAISANVTGRFGSGYGAAGGFGLWLSTPSNIQVEIAEFLRSNPTTFLLQTLDQPQDGGEQLLFSYLAEVPGPRFNAEPGFLEAAPGDFFGASFNTSVEFVYGQPFSIASALAGAANDTGSLSAMNSAHFGIRVLDNPSAQIAAESGTTYAAAVPEPQAYAMLLSGLGLVGWVAGRRRRPAMVK